MSKVNDSGVSFSVKYADELGIDPKHCLEAALKELGVTRLRLMSYWDIHESRRGKYDFKELDWQFKLAYNYDTQVSLAIGLRQPRWPESHWPTWAKELHESEWQQALLDFITQTVNRYKNHPCLVSWQLENEALLKSFGMDGNYDRQRLQRQFDLIKNLDGDTHPIIMSTSDSWGIPLKKPRPDIYGFSLYRRFYDRGRYRRSRRPVLFYKIRGKLITLITGRQVFVHELQTEPWGPIATVNMSLAEQQKTMNPDYLLEAVNFAKDTGLMPCYLWGLEWWYWLKVKHKQEEMWQTAKDIFVPSP